VDRREFVRRSMWSAAGLTIMRRLQVLFPELGASPSWPSGRGTVSMPTVHADTTDFIILQPTAPLPPGVDPPEYLMPRGCGVEGTDSAIPTALMVEAVDADELAGDCGFPVYAIAGLPPLISLNGGASIKDDEGRVFEGVLRYQVCGVAECDALLYTVAEAYFYHPYPLWQSEPGEDAPCTLVEAPYLPTPGYIVDSESEFTLYWVENDILYSVWADKSAYSSPSELASSLVKVLP
jgi:hypothetical protein